MQHRHTHTHTTVLRLCGFCPGQPGWAGTRRNIHPLTPIVVINHPLSASSIYYDPWHPPCSVYVPGSFFAQSLSRFSLVYFSISYSIHFFTQLLSSFCSTCPYHGNLFCCNTNIMSSNPSHFLNPSLGSDIHLTTLKYHLIFLSNMPGLTSMYRTTSHTTAVQSPPSHCQWYILIW